MRLLTIALLACTASFAQTAQSYPQLGQPWHQPMGWVPNSATAVTNSDSTVAFLYLSNTSGSQTTCTLVDTSTACGGSACSFWPTITLAANTVYTVPMGGVYVKGGVKWSCVAGTTVVGWMLGNYVPTLVTGIPKLFDVDAIPYWAMLNKSIRELSLSTAAVNGHPATTFGASK